MGAPGAVDPRSETGQAVAQDRHAFGDERDLLSPANRLHGAICRLESSRSVRRSLEKT